MSRAVPRTLWLVLAVGALGPGAIGARAQTPRSVPATTQFDADLFRAVASTSRDRTVFVSPLSAYITVAMAYEAAAGTTREAIGRTLGLPNGGSSPARSIADRLGALKSDRETTVSFANSLWVRADAPIDATYRDEVQSALHVKVIAADLTSPSTVAQINGWVPRETHGRIHAMLAEPLPEETVAVLMNAAYFKASWVDAFDARDTRPRPFRTRAGKVQSRPAMMRRGEYAYVRREGFEALRIPYRGGRFSMYVLLPDSSTSLDRLIGELAPKRSAEWMAALSQREVYLQLPKFRLEDGADLVAPLTSLGMGIAFDAAHANFGRMLPASYLARRNAYIGRAAQKTFVMVNEEGTEAAASTLIALMADSAGPRAVRFIVDRPFLFLIREETRGTVVFIGQVVDPG